MDRVNDFAFKIATVNGTGSASANGLLMQAIFRMGIPVTGKNVFPSNIQGLPTWYEIRVNKDGYTARTPHFDLMVALNPATYAKDVAEVRAAAGCSTTRPGRSTTRSRGRTSPILGVPLADLCTEAFKGVRERILMKNIAYAGALAALLGIDIEVIRALTEKFSKKKALLDSNDTAIALGYDYAKDHFACPLPIRLERMDATKDTILIDGNTAAGAGLRLCRRDGRRVVPDHAVHLADGGVQGVLPEVPRRPGDGQEPLRHPPGGRRAGGRRHGDRRLVGRARGPSRRPRVRASR